MKQLRFAAQLLATTVTTTTTPIATGIGTNITNFAEAGISPAAPPGDSADWARSKGIYFAAFSALLLLLVAGLLFVSRDTQQAGDAAPRRRASPSFSTAGAVRFEESPGSSAVAHHHHKEEHDRPMKFQRSTSCSYGPMADAESASPPPESEASESELEGSPLGAIAEGEEAPARPIARRNSIDLAIRTITRELGVKQEAGRTYIVVHTHKLVQQTGISGLCVADPDAQLGVTGMKVWTITLVTALQAFTVQFCMLAWVYWEIVPRHINRKAEAQGYLTTIIRFACVYLHFLHCLSDAPLDFFLLKWLQRRTESCRWMISIFLIDAFVIPITTAFLGALYILNAMDAQKCLFNACALSIIPNIDDWILHLSRNMERLAARTDYHKAVKLEIGRKTVQRINWFVSVLPVLPAGFTCLMMWLGAQGNL